MELMIIILIGVIASYVLVRAFIATKRDKYLNWAILVVLLMALIAGMCVYMGVMP